MATQLKTHKPFDDKSSPEKRRSAWRQKLVDTERGFTAGFRSDSTFFVHFFIGSVLVATGLILGLHTLQWSIFVLALTVVLSAEMFHQVLKGVLKNFSHHFSHEMTHALRIASAAVFVAILGAVLAIGLVFGERLSELFSG
ncbi:MAG: hypothetical protein Tsb009_36260 [Planctomycetaceae bacterium]